MIKKTVISYSEIFETRDTIKEHLDYKATYNDLMTSCLFVETVDIFVPRGSICVPYLTTG